MEIFTEFIATSVKLGLTSIGIFYLISGIQLNQGITLIGGIFLLFLGLTLRFELSDNWSKQKNGNKKIL